MRATIHDLGKFARKPLTIVAAASVVIVSAIAINQFGYLVWRRFPVSVLIVVVSYIWLGIADRINENRLSHIVGLMSKGLMLFAIGTIFGGTIDGVFFAETGYFSFAAHVLLWLWVAFESYRGLQILSLLSPQSKEKITESVTVIVAQMTATERQNELIIEESRRVLHEIRTAV